MIVVSQHKEHKLGALKFNINIAIFETSAKAATEVEAAFRKAAQLALSQGTMQADFIPETISFRGSPANGDSKSSCC